MSKTVLKKKNIALANGVELPVFQVHTLIVGSGSATLKAANRLHQLGIEDMVILTESVKGGTSYNTGSDKQTYYRLATDGKEPDSPYMMAQDLYRGGAMHGDLALVESLGSPESFYYLTSLGVPFPIHQYGGYVGYKTDHDSRKRGCSIGPYTSKEMVRVLLQEVQRRNIPIHEQTEVISLITSNERVVGAVAIARKNVLNDTYGLCLYMADNVVFGTGGPGGIYQDSVYPSCHSGAIGLALEIGAEANNLTETQFGLASTKFRWNVSGSYQQVIPCYVSTDADGNDEREFLQPFFESTAQMCEAIFLKGYQWPFDVKKILDHGSSLIDILVYRERVLLGRRVFLDFTKNPGAVSGSTAFSLNRLKDVPRTYLERSEAFGATPYERLQKMNPQAVELYRTHNIDLETERLEIAVCSQHNNGGLSVDIWWESENIQHLFPVGEVAGTHGVERPGGTALNSGQVGAERAARKIAGSYREPELQWNDFMLVAKEKATSLFEVAKRAVLSESEQLNVPADGMSDLRAYRKEYRTRMSRVGAMVREKDLLEHEILDAKRQVDTFGELRVNTPHLLPKLFQTRHLVLTHYVYLHALLAFLKRGGGSRGSALVFEKDGTRIHKDLETAFRYKEEQIEDRDKILTTIYREGGCIHKEIDCRVIPEDDFWFEIVWRDYLLGKHLEAHG